MSVENGRLKGFIRFDNGQTTAIFEHAEDPSTMTDLELNLAIGHALGWVTYPLDPVEKGRVFHIKKGRIFHKDAATSLTGEICSIYLFTPSTSLEDLLPMIIEHKVPINHVLNTHGIKYPRYLANELYKKLVQDRRVNIEVPRKAG